MPLSSSVPSGSILSRFSITYLILSRSSSPMKSRVKSNLGVWAMQSRNLQIYFYSSKLLNSTFLITWLMNVSMISFTVSLMIPLITNVINDGITNYTINAIIDGLIKHIIDSLLSFLLCLSLFLFLFLLIS